MEGAASEQGAVWICRVAVHAAEGVRCAASLGLAAAGTMPATPQALRHRCRATPAAPTARSGPSCPAPSAPCSLFRREIVRRLEAGTLPQPPPPARGMSPAQAADALALGASHPTWLVAGWLQQYGPKATMELLKWNNRWAFCFWAAAGFCFRSWCKWCGVEAALVARPVSFCFVVLVNVFSQLVPMARN